MDETKLKQSLPISTYFILITEFCERFSYYGMRSVLALFLTSYLDLSESGMMMTFHMFSVVSYGKINHGVFNFD